MPSRAVLRKITRRESMRRKRDAEGVATAAAAAVAVVDASSSLQDEQNKQHSDAAEGKEQSPLVACRKRPRAAAGEGAEKHLPTQGMSRKERRRLETRRLFERKLERLGATVLNKESTLADADNNKNSEMNTKGNPNDNVNAVSTPSSNGLRHDPRFKNGTFWRTRKEQRGRTVFLGNVPTRFTVQNVMDLVNSLLDATDTVPEWGTTVGAAVDSVDFLPAKPQAMRRHMFVTLQSREVAARVAKLLDSHQLDGVALRCNFSSDKTQRNEAIRRRSGRS